MLDALKQTLQYERRPTGQDALVHLCDRSVRYVSLRYTERLAEAGIEPSVRSVTDSCDNALAETINGQYTIGVIRRRAPWKAKAAVVMI